MPGFDGTGPRGMGPMTGGGRGFCSPWGIGAAFRGGAVPPYWAFPYSYPGAAPYPSYGGAPAGATLGAVGAQGMTPFAPQMSREQELDFLKNQAQSIKGQLEQIEARMRELEKKE